MLRNTNSILKIVSPNFCRAMHVFNGNSRILKWRYCTICLAIFWVYIPLHRPYIGLIYGRYLQFRFLKWPLMFFFHTSGGTGSGSFGSHASPRQRRRSHGIRREQRCGGGHSAVARTTTFGDGLNPIKV